MKITIEIPKDFEQDFKDNKFSEALNSIPFFKEL